MALTKDTFRTTHKSGQSEALEMVNAEVAFKGSLLALNTLQHATAANRGRVRTLAVAKGNFPIGDAQLGATGNTSASPTVKAQVDVSDRVWHSVTVTGVADITAVGQLVYASDDDTLTLTRPSYGDPVGVVIQHISGSTCNVYMLGLGARSALSASGQGKYLQSLGSYDVATMPANADIATDIELPHHAKIVKVFAIADAVVAGAGTVTLSAAIGGVFLTGGVITVTTAALGTKGAKAVGTAITAGNTFHEGDMLRLRSQLTGTLTAGRVNIFALMETLVGT